MSYRIENADIVISGFEAGIADSVYTGPAEMRNIDIIGVPGEASVAFSMAEVSQPPVRNATAFTAQNTGDTLTVASTTGFYEGMAIVLNTNSAGGISTGVVYYVRNIVGLTFQIGIAPSGSVTAVTSDGSGTFTTYQYGNQRSVSARAPISYTVDRAGNAAGRNGTYLLDGSNYAWVVFPAVIGTLPANTLIFLGNIGGIGASAGTANGIAVWNEYLMLFGGASQDRIDVANINDLIVSGGPAAEWTYGWQTGLGMNATNGRINTLVSQEDGNLYWISRSGLGSIIETPGSTFDPGNATTYSVTDDAISIPDSDESTCIAELGINLLIGGRGSFIYVWDKLSLGFTGLLNIPDTYTTTIVATSQNAYAFSGSRGRIYITNGSGIDLYKKVPDYLTGTIRPYIQWLDASSNRNQLYFSFIAYTNANVALTTTGGTWAIDLESDSLRMSNKTSNSGYSAIVRMVSQVPLPTINITTNVAGDGVMTGWYSGTTYGVDVGASTPYTAYESYLQTEMIPVGTYLDSFTGSQIEWKTSAPLVSGEGVRISYRSNISDSFTTIGESTTVGLISDFYQVNFQKVQWVQFQVEIKSTASSPSYTRLTEIRIRDFPSGKDNR